MKTLNSRRVFLRKTTLAGLAVPLVGHSLLSCKSDTKNAAASIINDNPKLKILILGGTSYLGPHQIAYALQRGHEVSTFTRGKTKPKINAELFDQVEQLIGDREDNLEAIKNRQWDVVIDNSGRKVEWTQATANLLKDTVDHYMYTSSTGVYYPYLKGNLTEDTEVALEVPNNLSKNEKYEMDYGVMKANSELVAINTFGKNRTTVIRPTYMLGPGDRTDRFIHWPVRLSRGGEHLVPGKKEDLVQYVDVRDIAEWFIRLAEQKSVGIYNGVGPSTNETMIEFINKAAKTFDVNSYFVVVDDYDFLMKNDMYYSIPWIMPDEKHFGSARVSTAKAIANGLTYRPLTDTINDTLTWWNSDQIDTQRKTNFNQNLTTLLEKEKEMISEWKKSKLKI